MFTKREGNDIVVLLVYVDDLMIIGNSKRLVQELKKVLTHNFEIKDLGNLKYLGMEITCRPKRGINQSQRKYIL